MAEVSENKVVAPTNIVMPDSLETTEGGMNDFDEADSLFGNRTDVGRQSENVVPNNRTTDPQSEVVPARRGRPKTRTIISDDNADDDRKAEFERMRRVAAALEAELRALEESGGD